MVRICRFVNTGLVGLGPAGWVLMAWLCNSVTMSRLVDYVSGLTGSVHVLRLEVQVEPILLFPVSEAVTLTFGIQLTYLHLHAVSGQCLIVYRN
jgi:hypothetical protein